MKTQVTFRSAKFPAYEGEEDETNPGVWGKRLTEYLAAQLSARDITTDPAIAEDWGWILPVRNDAFPTALCCGHQDGDQDEFLVFTEPSKPFVRRGFKKVVTTAQLQKLTNVVDAILTSDADITDVLWTDA